MSGILKIGSVEIKRTAALAPMAGVADRAYRVICKRSGAAYVVSEMVSVNGICHNDRKTEALCRITDEERPMAVQLFGSDPGLFAEAVGAVSGFAPDVIDINMGCPVPKVVAGGSGCALMRDPKLAEEIVSAAVAASPGIPVTVKIRSGWSADTVNAAEFAKVLEQAGASAVAVHGRTREQFYSGKADMGVIADVKRAVSIPVIGSGDVTDAGTCLEMYEKTGCDLVMIGRGSYGNPFVFEEINAGAGGRGYTAPTVSGKMSKMLEHIKLMLEFSEKSEELAMHDARKVAAWYMSGYYCSAKFRDRCFRLTSFRQAEELAEEFISVQDSHRLNDPGDVEL